MPVLLSDLPEHARLIAKLSAVTDLPPAEVLTLLKLQPVVREFERGADIVREDERPLQACLMLSGFACRYKMLADGGRQIMSFHIAGDIPDLQSVHLPRMDHSVGVLAPTRVAAFNHDDLRRAIYGNPTVCHLLWRDTLVDASIHRAWMMGLGRLPARSRIAHLLCEMLVKHQAAGLTRGHSFELPLTQSELADALGLSPVHVNRVLQELRAEGLIQIARRGEATIIDWERLQEVGAFDVAYLHMEGGEIA